MNDPRIESSAPRIAALLEREARAYPEDPALKAAVLAQTELAAGLRAGLPDAPHPPAPAPGGSAAATPAGSAAAGAARFGVRALAAVGISAFLAGGVVGGLVMRSTPAPAPIPSPSASAPIDVAPVPPPSSPAAPPSASASTSAPPPAPLPATASATAAPSPRGNLTRERELLDAAHAALARGRPGDALAAAERHAAQWPRGYLGEEREVVLIQALAALGRRGEAEQRAAQYRRTHPKSLFLPAVDAAVPPREKESRP
ncbi:MAG: hypothetical protein QM820_05970 [Minicystis sp.]